MNALLSGQAGIAIFVQGNTLSVVEVESPDVERVLHHTSIDYLFADATDVEELRSVSREAVIDELRLAWRRDRALQLSLLLLDGAEDEETRHLASDCLEELLGELRVCDHVANSLYAAPLPAGADLNGARTAAGQSKTVIDLLADIEAAQPQTAQLREAWVRLPPNLFRDDRAKRAFERALVTCGAFRTFATTCGDAAHFALARVEYQTKLAALPNSRRVFEAWLKDIQPTRATLDVGKSPRMAASEVSTVADDRKIISGRRATGHAAFENVKKQKEAIVALMKGGNWRNVRKFADELRAQQMRSADPTYAAKSLCDLAQRAKEVCNCSMQLELANMAIEVAPDDGWAHGQIADAYFCLGRYEEAAQHFEEAGKLGEKGFAATGRARILRAQVRLDDALEAYQQAIAGFPESVFAWVGRAEVLRDMCRLDDALQAYEAAIERFATERSPRCGKAAVLNELGRLDEAMQVYEQCIQENTEDVIPWCGRAYVLRNKGCLEEALEAFGRAIQTFPASSQPRTGHAAVLKAMGRLNEAQQEYTDIVSEFPYEVMPACGRAEVFRKMRELGRALAAYDDVVLRFPHDPVAHCGRANVLKEKGRHGEALQAYDAIVAKFPYQVFAWSARADLLKELGHSEDALRAYDKLIEMPWNPNKPGAQYAKAAVLVAMGRFAEGAQLLPGGEPRTREEWIAYHIRGMILLRTGKLDDAVALLERGLRDNPYADERRYFENALAVANLRLNRFPEALRFLGDDQTPLADVIRMHAFGAVRQTEDARKAYQRIEAMCPPPLILLRDALAALYSLRHGFATPTWSWVFEEECRNVLYAAG